MLHMKLVSVRESVPGERRISLTPGVTKRLVGLGAEVQLESGYGEANDVADEVFVKAGATFAPRADLLAGAEVLVGLNPPDVASLQALPEGAIVVSFLDPFRRGELVALARDRNLSTLVMELVPRTSYAQKMDALSSQASLGGYAAVITAADRSPKSFPMMSTPAGTIPPARVFVVGVGVAGLQAIATAKRLGARVEAYDTRPVVAEQVQSLGAKFVELDVGETGQTEQGYAKELTEEQLAEQRRQMAKVVAGADVVITTAQLFGRPAPRIIDAEMVSGMKPGSVIVDMAASTGGNVEGSVADEEVVVGGIRIVGFANLPGQVARDASEMYASNVFALIEHAWDRDANALALTREGDEVLGGCLLTHAGAVLDARVAKSLPGGAA